MRDPSNHDPNHDPRDEGGGESNRTFVIAFVFVAVLAVAGVFLVRALIDMVRAQDCAITGRQNC